MTRRSLPQFIVWSDCEPSRLTEDIVKNTATKMEYWVEVNHSDVCSMCRDGVPGCATGKPGKRIRTAQFLYFMEAIDYAQECQRRGVPVWLRKPIYVGNDPTRSEYSLYAVKDGKPALLQTPVVLDGKAGLPA